MYLLLFLVLKIQILFNTPKTGAICVDQKTCKDCLTYNQGNTCNWCNESEGCYYPLYVRENGLVGCAIGLTSESMCPTVSVVPPFPGATIGLIAGGIALFICGVLAVVFFILYMKKKQEVTVLHAQSVPQAIIESTKNHNETVTYNPVYPQPTITQAYVQPYSQPLVSYAPSPVVAIQPYAQHAMQTNIGVLPSPTGYHQAIGGMPSPIYPQAGYQ